MRIATTRCTLASLNFAAGGVVDFVGLATGAAEGYALVKGTAVASRVVAGAMRETFSIPAKISTRALAQAGNAYFANGLFNVVSYAALDSYFTMSDMLLDVMPVVGTIRDYRR